MSAILDLIDRPDSIAVFDVDGVLARYEHGERNHNACSDEEYRKNARYWSAMLYDSAKPVSSLQELIRDKKNCYVCSVSSHGEADAKISFIRRFYNIPEENIILVPNKFEKLSALNRIKAQHPNISPELIIMIDDTIEVLTHIQDNSQYSTCHISSFLE